MSEHRQLNRNSSALIPDFDDQDEVFTPAFAILADAIANDAFPGASVAVTHSGKLKALQAFGSFVFGNDIRLFPELSTTHDKSKVAVSTLFDLASVTKVVATTTMAAILYERGLLELEAPIAGTIPKFLSDPERDSRRAHVTFRMLLAHSSGLPAYEKLFLRFNTRDELLDAVFDTPLKAEPGSRAEYSDIGFIILGVALERLAGEPIESFCQREIFGPLGMVSTTFNPPAELRAKIPPTANDQTFRHRIIQGEVQDENASFLGGVAGHAGLFASAEDVARFSHAMMNGGSPILRPETIDLFTRREPLPHGRSRALGWDTPSNPSQSGRFFSARSFGHLGYTGTSLWIAPDRQISITLLTNRTWPDCANQAIKQIRPRFHDAVMQTLLDREA